MPSHLRYVFLGDHNTLLIIVAGDLETYQGEAFKAIVNNFIHAIGWTISNIIGIAPKIYSHKIKLEQDQVPSIERQRQFNHSMQEVVKKEITKWLDEGVINPISNSIWESPVQCVPKKGGITIVQNEKNYLIPIDSFMGWMLCMDYRKLNSWVEKDDFPMSFIDEILGRIA